MDWAGIFSGILSNGLYALFIVGCGLMLALMRKKWPGYADQVRNGLIGAACVAIVLYALLGRGLFIQRPPEITQDNVEKYVRQWSDEVGYGVTTVGNDIPMYQNVPMQFGLRVTLKSGNPMYVFLAKTGNRWLQVYLPMGMAQEHLEILNRLTKDEREIVNDEITAEICKANVMFQNLTVTGPMGTNGLPMVTGETMGLNKGIPIDSSFTEMTFLSASDELDRAAQLLKATTSLALTKYGHNKHLSVKQQ